MTVAQPAAPPDIPVMDGRKTLLIGLGSTGAMVCNQILERLTWTYDSLDNVPWIKCLTLETAPVAAEKMVHTQGRFQHLTIDSNEYGGLLANPQNFRDSLDFPAWSNREVIGTGDSIRDGANNIRMLGRLALLFPANFTRVQKELDGLLQQLNALTNQAATDRIKRGLKSHIQVLLSQDIYVYVVGTLCGGTASGSFIDLGYMLKALPGLDGYHLTTTGIFMLPSPMANTDKHVANAMAGLVELNHFSNDRSRYRTQFPFSPGVPWQTQTAGERPYQNLYLVQSRGGSDTDYARLVTTTADYIYSDAIGSSALVRDGARTNIAECFMQRDYWGATQKYFTFGMSVIEFPYTKVLKGCTLRLADRGFQLHLGSETLTENEMKAEMEKMPLLTRKRLQDVLLRRQDESLGVLLDAALSDCFDSACQTGTGMDLVISQLDAAFEGSVPNPLPRLPVRVVPTTLEENSRGVAKQLDDSIRATVNTFLTGDEPRALDTLVAFLASLESLLTPRGGRQGETPLTELRGEMDTARSRVQECRHDALLKLVMQTKPAVRRYVEEFIEAAKTYYGRRLRDAAAPTTDAIQAETLQLVQTLKRRITDDTVGLRGEVEQIVSKMTQLYGKNNVKYDNQTDPWSRTINGKELFEPTQTIEQEYWSCLETTAQRRGMRGDKAAVERRLALTSVQPYFAAAAEALFLPPNRTSRFDPGVNKKTPDYGEAALLMFAFPARQAFEPLRDQSIIDRLLDRPDIASVLADVDGKGNVFLERQKSHPRYHPDNRKSIGFVFYNQSHPRADEFLHHLQAAGVVSGTTQARTMTDPHQVLILREEGAFSLGTITPLRDEVPTHWWNAFANPPGLATLSLHSRADIKEWITWKRKDEEDRARVRNTFLVAAALDVIKFRSAREYVFEYEPTSPADPGFVKFTDDLDDSARIMKSQDVEGLVELHITDKRRLEGTTEMVRRIVEFIQGSNNRFREGDRRLSPQDIQVYLLDYLFADQEMRHIYSTDFYKNAVELSYLKTDANGQEAYFCPNPECNQKLGYSADSLYKYKIENGTQSRTRQCTYCDAPIP